MYSRTVYTWYCVWHGMGMPFVALPFACYLHVCVRVFEVVVATVAFGMGIGEVIGPSLLY